MDYELYMLGVNAIMIELSKEINEETQKEVLAGCRFFEESKEEWQIEYIYIDVYGSHLEL